MTGRLIAVVGPSGVGKDTVMAGLAEAVPGLRPVRRVITRASEPEGEAFESVNRAEFNRRIAFGAFALHWGAHGLLYGIPTGIRADLAGGRDLLVNLSRRVLPNAAEQFPDLHVLSLTAEPEVLATRLRARGREPAQDIAARLDRAGAVTPPGVPVTEVANNGALDRTIAQAVAGLFPVKA